MGIGLLLKKKGSGGKTLNLGTNTTFNVSSISGIKLQETTNDNFYMTYAGDSFSTSIQYASCSASVTPGNTGWCGSSNGTGNIAGKCSTSSVSTTKSFNNTTGALTFRCMSSTKINCYYVQNPEKNLISLGNGQTFNIKSLAPNIDYTKLTVDNFVTKSYSASGDSITECCSPGCPASVGVYKNYNSETGILSWYYSRYRNGSSNMSNVYLIPKIPKAA